MTRRKWTTAKQEDWLKARLAEFGNAQANKTTSKEFFPMVLKEWRDTWPTPDATQEEVAQAGSVEKATKKKRAEEDTRVKSWFHNHTRGATSGNGSRGLLKLKAKPKALQEWQVYQLMTYETQWKAVIDKEWETYKSTWEAENPGTELDKTRFTFMNSFMKEKYLEQTEEVQSSVRKRREDLKAEVDADGEDKNTTYQNAIDRLPCTLAVWGESIRKQTGWNISFLVGGPAPHQSGKIMSYMLHCGKSPDGQDFEDFLGENGYKEHIIAPFDDFLHEAFPPDVCNTRSLGSKATTPDDGDTREISGDGNNGDGETSDDEMDVSAVEGGNSANRGGKSEYKRSREANIAKNKMLFQELAEKFRSSDEGNDASENKKQKKKDKKKATQEPTRSSARLSAPTLISEDKNTNDGVLDSVSHQVDDVAIASAGDIESTQTLSSKEPDVDLSNDSTSGSLGTSLIPQTTSSSDAPSNAIGSSTTATTSTESVAEDSNEDAKSTSPPAPLLASALSSNSSTSNAIGSSTTSTTSADSVAEDSHEDAKSTSPPAPLLASALSGTTPFSNAIGSSMTSTTSAESVAEDSYKDAKSILPPAPSIASAPMVSSITTNDAASMDIDAGKNSSESLVTADPMQVDVENPPKGESSSIDVAVIAPPDWLMALNMNVYLQECSEATAWRGLIESLYKFENLNTITGKLPTTMRPEEVGSWIKSKKKNSPPDIDVDKFASSFMAWWIALQPGWRLADDGSFTYDAPKSEDWHALHKGGSAGLYIVVVALSWWVRALMPESPSFRAWTAVRDVQWVIDQIMKRLTPARRKRPLEDSAESGKAKKGRRG